MIKCVVILPFASFWSYHVTTAWSHLVMFRTNDDRYLIRKSVRVTTNSSLDLNFRSDCCGNVSDFIDSGTRSRKNRVLLLPHLSNSSNYCCWNVHFFPHKYQRSFKKQKKLEVCANVSWREKVYFYNWTRDRRAASRFLFLSSQNAEFIETIFRAEPHSRSQWNTLCCESWILRQGWKSRL
jgi:hypothetical protein